MKQCFKCERQLPLTDFYRHAQMADGHLNKCKQCTKNDVATYQAENAEAVQAYERKRGGLLHRVEARRAYHALLQEDRPEQLREYRQRWIVKNPEKRAAHVAVGNALRDKRLVKGPCEKCGTTKRIHGHHDDYSKPLSVQWLCSKHHKERHRELNMPL